MSQTKALNSNNPTTVNVLNEVLVLDNLAPEAVVVAAALLPVEEIAPAEAVFCGDAVVRGLVDIPVSEAAVPVEVIAGPDFVEDSSSLT